MFRNIDSIVRMVYFGDFPQISGFEGNSKDKDGLNLKVDGTMNITLIIPKPKERLHFAPRTKVYANKKRKEQLRKRDWR